LADREPKQKETMMSDSQELAVREKQELERQEEKTSPGRYYVPAADIFETDEALTLMLEMPGVDKDKVDIQIENDVLRVEGKIDFQHTRRSSLSTRSIMSATTRAHSPCRTRSIVKRSRRGSKMVCSH
jgi:HSP20 family molecular chaperone IbpA